MNIDAFSTIGELHKGAFCQDYFLHGISPRPFLLLSDGCSSSEHTDLGSRLMLHSAAKIIKGWNINPDYIISDDFVMNVVQEAMASVKSMSLDPDCLNATLLAAVYFPERKVVSFSMTGDGFVFWKNKDQKPVIVQVNYTDNAPYYPPVLESKEYRKQWDEAFPNNRMVIRQLGGEASVEEPCVFNGQVPVANLEWFGFSTDGLDSFKVDHPNGVQIENVFGEVFNLKTMAGAFLQRRMNRQMKMWRDDGFVNMDDISVGMMYYFGD